MATQQIPARACPHCGAPLQRLHGADGHAVDVVFTLDDNGQWVRGRSHEQRRLDAVYACPRCEFCGRAGKGAA